MGAEADAPGDADEAEFVGGVKLGCVGTAKVLYDDMRLVGGYRTTGSSTATATNSSGAGRSCFRRSMAHCDMKFSKRSTHI